MSLSRDAMQVANNVDFENRIRYHLTTAAISVMSEDVGTTGHAERVLYANKVLTGVADYHSAAIAVLTNSTIAAAINLSTEDFGIADTDLPFTINSMFNALAGV